ncbi:MAG: CDP-alcohol phosphatidyltransferase family protein [Candidatus Omnitrophica bacterium]|nr:CDP-alcohol phosphatidyltransferase family protein [Candidatus Omnitrophota bacterium]
MSLANRISVFRILLAPCIVASLVYYSPSRDGLRSFTLALFIIGIFSDAIDGFVARSKNQHSELGAVLDPIADKLLILSSLISLSIIKGLPSWMRIPAWFNLIVISRDAILLVGVTVIFLIKGTMSIKPSFVGKCAIVAQMCIVPAVLLKLPIKPNLLAIAAALTVLSGIGYLRAGLRVLS